MSYLHVALVAVLLLLVSWLALQSCAVGGSPPTVVEPIDPLERAAELEAVETVRVVIADRLFDLELALTPEERYQGLSDRDWIAPDGGMLFVFPDAAERAFVMRRCLVPIDLIYLDDQGKVVNVHQMEVEPYRRPEVFLTRYRSEGPAQYVIELAGGTLDELDLSPGDPVDLPDDLKARAR